MEHGAAPSARDLVGVAPFAISFSLDFGSCDLQDLGGRRSSYHADAIRYLSVVVVASMNLNCI